MDGDSRSSQLTRHRLVLVSTQQQQRDMTKRNESRLIAVLGFLVVGSALGQSPTKVRITTWKLEWFPNGSPPTERWMLYLVRREKCYKNKCGGIPAMCQS